MDLGKLWLFINSGCCVWGLMVSRTFLDLIDDSKKKEKKKKEHLFWVLVQQVLKKARATALSHSASVS